MDTDRAVIAFSALSQETRLRVFRLLIAYGDDGAPAGALSEELGIPHNTLSFHLAHLRHAGLVTSRKQGRSVRYAARGSTIEKLIDYLKDQCCIRSRKSKTCKLKP